MRDGNKEELMLLNTMMSFSLPMRDGNSGLITMATTNLVVLAYL